MLLGKRGVKNKADVSENACNIDIDIEFAVDPH